MPDLQLEIRPLRIPEDFPMMAEVLNSVQDFPTTPEELERQEQLREAKYHRAVYVAEVLEGEARRIVGVVTVGHDSFSFEEGKFWVNVSVLPEYQRRGVGTALWQTALNHLEGWQPTKLVNMTNSDSSSGLEFLEKLGFRQVWERIESRLDPKDVDFSQYTDLDARLEAAGIRTITFAEITDADKIRKLYDLDVELFADVPFGTPITMPSFEQWEKELLSDPRFNPETLWIAQKGDEWIAFSSLDRIDDWFVIGMTGVKRAYRGLGVAKRLKLEGVKYALAHGGLEIRTMNDHVNEAMLGMNYSMGFKRYRSRYRFEKIL